MVETFFKRSCTIHRLRQGPLAGHIDLLADRLAADGFSRVHSRIQLRLVGHFNRWLDQKGITAEQLDEHVIERYRRYLRPRKNVRSEDLCSLVRLLDLLREQGVTPRRNIEAVPTAREILLERYRCYLSEERGLAEASLRNMLLFVHRFLAEKYPQDHFDFAALKVDDITPFIRRQATELSSVQAKHLVTALRGFFRYLRHRGEIDTDLAGCVPSVPDYSFSIVPKFLPAGSIEKILRRTDRGTPRGRRDYAILMLLAGLGLRSSEIVRLELEDVDWDLGQITVRGKGGRWSKLPLAADVGEALAAYIQHSRPRCSTRRLFVTQRAPIAGLGTGCAIVKTITRALTRADIVSERKGGHLFRHTLATEMLGRGASWREIGQVLRHRKADTTRIYAKVDSRAFAKARPAVARRCAMRDLRKDLRKDLREYIDLRRALGYKLRKHERRLSEFITFLESRRADHITTKLAIAWATESSKDHRHSCFERLSFIRSFATDVSSMDTRTEIPAINTIRRPAIALRPYIYTREEIGRLMAAARNLFSPRKLRSHTYYHLIGLLATTGLRSGEAVRLANSDVNLDEGLIVIRESKFGKSRVVPIHPTTVRALAGYRARRDMFLKRAEASTFFISERRGPISGLHKTFRAIRRAAGLEKTRNGFCPRMHDLRHTLAVQTLLNWYRNGLDVECHLPILSTFLGHSQVKNTYWYLSSTPELMGAACERLEKRWRRSPGVQRISQHYLRHSSRTG